MHRIKTMVFISVFVIFAAGTVFAQPTEEGNASRKTNIKEAMQKKLGITEEQQQKLEDNRKAQAEVMKNIQEGMKQQRGKLQEALKDPAVTRSSVDPIVAEMKSLQAQLIDQRINGIFTAKSILTPEQFEKFTEMTEKRFDGKKEGLREERKERRRSYRNREDGSFSDEPPPPED